MAAAISSCKCFSEDKDKGREGPRILILEKKNRPGSKIPATGNGRCNLSNEYMDPSCYRTEAPDRAWAVLSSFGRDWTRQFFKEIGLVTKSMEGYIYPYHEQAGAVRDLLESAIEKEEGICLLTDREALHIRPLPTQSGDSLFQVATAKGACLGKKVIITSGGFAGPSFGCSGDGYRMAEEVGHRLVKPLPALTALVSGAPFLKKLSGVRCHAGVSLYIGGRKAAWDTGQIQWTDYGVSGVVIFQVSRYAVRALEGDKGKKKNGEKVLLTIDFMPDYEEEEVKNLLLSMSRISQSRTMASLLQGFFHKKLIPVILREAGIEEEGQSADAISGKQWERLLSAIKAFPLKITGYKGYDKAQVTQGGVPLTDLDGDLQSCKHKGLYFAGEVVDVDGICGGYNLQWAWSSGAAAGIAAAKAVLCEE